MKRINIRNTCLFAVVAGLLLALASCSHKNEFVEIVSADKTKPAPISEYNVSNFNGGAFITYKLPKVDNILYVQADYDLSGGTNRHVQTRSSYFSDTITVEGFEDAREYEVKLTVVSRANIPSDPITVKVQPDIPVYQLVAKNLTMEPDFQGVRILAVNENRKNVGIVFLDDQLGNYSIRQQNFSDFQNVSYAIRGYDTIQKVFAAYVTDKWGNRSDTVFTSIKPLFEKALDKKKFARYALASETPIYNNNTQYPLSNLWDGNYTNFWHTIQNSATVTMPVYGTFNLGTAAKLSRFKFTPRNPNYEYRHGCPKLFTIWASDAAAPADFVVPLQSAEGTRIGDWVNLGNYEYPNPPSGAAPGLSSYSLQSDKDFFNKGIEFNFPFSVTKFRYIRFAVSETFTPGTFTHGAEIDVYGDDR